MYQSGAGAVTMGACGQSGSCWLTGVTLDLQEELVEHDHANGKTWQASGTGDVDR